MKPSVQYLLECYSGGRLIDDDYDAIPEDLDRSLSYQNQPKWTTQGAHFALVGDPFIENAGMNERNGALNLRQRQNIRNLAQQLKITADSLQIRSRSALLSVERAILANENLNHDEMLVVRSILSERTPTIPRIAEHLGKYMTSRTFRAVLRYLCYSASSAPEELALTCELVKVTYPRIKQLSRADSIYEVINEFVQDKLDDVLR